MEAERPVRTGSEVILVVDEDAESRASLSETLLEAGWTTREAATGPEAMNAAREEEPSAVVLDVELPGLTGYDVCRSLREEFGERLPIIFVSGSRTEPLDRVAGLLIGADDYVVKPYNPKELVARIRRSLTRVRRVRGPSAT